MQAETTLHHHPQMRRLFRCNRLHTLAGSTTTTPGPNPASRAKCTTVNVSGHERVYSQGAPTQMAMALAMSSNWPGVNSPSLSRKRVSETDLT
jgi:hypothetical protein